MKKQHGRQVHDVADTDSAINDELVGSITTVHSISSNGEDNKFPNKIFANVRFNNGKNKVKLKIDTGSDACLLTEEDFEKSGIKGSAKIHQSACVLHNYGGGTIKYLGTVTAKISCLDKSTTTDFRLVQSTGSPSLIGCRQAQELNLITFNSNQRTAALLLKRPPVLTQQTTDCVSVGLKNHLTKESVLQ